MRVPVLTRLAAALTLSVLIANASPATADPARSVDRSPAKPSAPVPAPSRAALDESFGRLPLQFEVNRGQVDPRVRYLTRGRGSTLFLTDDEAVWVLSRHEKVPDSETKNPLDRRDRNNRNEGERISSVVRMRFEGSKPKPRLEGLDRLPGYVNYFIGSDPRKWRTDVPTFRKVKVEDVYAGIDLLYYGNQRQVEYDFVVKPGVDPSVIRVAFSGADRMATDASGDLIVSTAAGDLRMKSPLVYQERDGQRELVAAAYVVRPGERRVEFRLAEYDRSRPLVIDPVIVWSTYVGPLNGHLTGAAVQGSGDLLLAGWARHDAFPTTPSALIPEDPSGPTVSTGVVLRLNAQGTALTYSTYLGGPTYNYFNSVASDSSGFAYVTGRTASEIGYPTTTGGDLVPDGTIVVSKLSPQGNSLSYSARIGGHDSPAGSSEGTDIEVDSQGNAYVCGTIVDGPMPIPSGAFQGLSAIAFKGSGFAAKLVPTGTALAWGTILGGIEKVSPDEAWAYSSATSIRPDCVGGAYVAGFTNAADFPTTPGAYKEEHSQTNETLDVFVVRLNPTATGAVYSTFLGSGPYTYQDNSETYSYPRVTIDAAGAAYVTGNGFPSYPSTPGAFLTGQYGAFVTKLSPDGSGLAYSTFVSPDGGGLPRGIAVDSAGQAIITGIVGIESNAFPVTPPNDPRTGGAYYLLRFDPTGSTLTYGSRFGAVNASLPVEEDPCPLTLLLEGMP